MATLISGIIEPNGWVLALTFNGVTSSSWVSGFSAAPANDTVTQWNTNFNAYALTPNTTPKLTLIGTSNGFNQSGSAPNIVAVASAAVSRTIIGTKVLRKPVEIVPLWAISTAYTVGQQIGNGFNLYLCTVAGTSATSGGPVHGSGTALDGTTLTWQYVPYSGTVSANNIRVPKRPDEVVPGAGTVVVRIALSQFVYNTDSGFNLTALPGWWTNAGYSGIATGNETITITNQSLIIPPQPIVRWTDVPYQLQPGTFTLEVGVASHHPIGLSPVAAVRFAVTDGTVANTKYFWASALSNSTNYISSAAGINGTGLPLRIYSVIVDPSTATALNKGLLRCDYKVFPWIGQARASDTADTAFTAVAASNVATGPSMASLNATQAVGTFGTWGAGLTTLAQSPFIVAYNPGNTFITPRFIDIDAVNGTTTPASVTIGTTASAAASGTPAIDVYTALTAMYNLNITVATANGQAAIVRSADGLTLTIRKANGTTGCTGIVSSVNTTANQYSGVNAGATFINVRGDPTDSTQRACIIRAPAAASSLAYFPSNGQCLFHFSNLSVEAGNYIAYRIGGFIWYDNIELRGSLVPTDQTTGSVNAITGGVGIWVTNSKWWKHGTSIGYLNNGQIPLLARQVSLEQSINALAVFNCARLPGASTYANNHGLQNGGVTWADPGFALDRMAVGNDFRYLNGAVALYTATLYYANAPATLQLSKGTPYNVVARHAWLNNLCESYNGGAAMWFGVGEQGQSIFNENIIEGNTLVGDRTNQQYNESFGPTIALTDTYDNLSQVNRYANNLTAKFASKQDSWSDQVLTGPQRVGVTLASTRNKSYNGTTGDQIVIAGTPAYIYQAVQTGAATTSNIGGSGPTGVTNGQLDGGVTWNFIGYEYRKHGYRTNALSSWSAHYGVAYENNVDLGTLSDAINIVDVWIEFFGVGSKYPSLEGLSSVGISDNPFTNDRSGGSNALFMQTAKTAITGGGGNYAPKSIGTSYAQYLLNRAKNANLDIDTFGNIRNVSGFAAGALEAFLAILNRMLMGIGS